MVAAPIRAAYINRVHQPYLGNQRSSVSNHTNRHDLSSRCLRIEGRHPQQAVPGQCRWRPEGIRTLTRSTAQVSTSTTMANKLPLGTV
jgi:hypothetical protein